MFGPQQRAQVPQQYGYGYPYYYSPTQTNGFDMTAMMNMIMMIVMLSVVIGMMKPLMGAAK